MAIVSISRAAKLVRKGRQTLYNHNDKGKLSFTQTVDGKPGIDTAELVRVYGKLYMPADDVETLIQDSQDAVGQSSSDSQDRRQSVQFGLSNRVSDVHKDVSNGVSLDNDAVSTLSWFMEQVDEAKQELSETQAQLAEREKSLAELRQAMAALPSPESVEQRLKEQADQLKQQHNEELESERRRQAKLLAEQKHREAQKVGEWQAAVEQRQKEIKKARAEADAIRLREQEQASVLKAEQAKVAALESRGLIARLFNKKTVGEW